MSIILPIIAAVIGFFIAYLLYQKKLGINLLLAFSGSFLLSVTVLEFLPSIYALNTPHIGIFILLGLLLQIVLEYLSGGAEHGHLHHDQKTKNFPWVLFVSLSLHALLEGFPLNHSDHLLYAVVIHKIPIAIIIASFLFQTNMSIPKIVAFLIAFAGMTPLGSFLQQQLEFFNSYGIYMNAIVIGIFLHVSTTILFESSRDHKFNVFKFGIILLGIGVALAL